MNTIKDIHLSHVKFTLDDEAYNILKAYLNKLSVAFSSNASKDEILEDIESHIAELFSKNNTVNQVISVSEVNKAIEVLGTPEELAEDETEAQSHSKNSNTNKKLFRDIDNSYVGGVASGLSHYFGISPAWIRVLFILFFWINFKPPPSEARGEWSLGVPRATALMSRATEGGGTGVGTPPRLCPTGELRKI